MTYKTDTEPEITVDFAAIAEEVVPLAEEVQSHVDPLGSGFLWYQPPMASTKSHVSGGHQWCISGYDMQVLTMTVPAGEHLTTEIGSFMFGSGQTETSVELTLCSRIGFAEGIRRILGGESCVKVILTNSSNQEGVFGVSEKGCKKIYLKNVVISYTLYCFAL